MKRFLLILMLVVFCFAAAYSQENQRIIINKKVLDSSDPDIKDLKDIKDIKVIVNNSDDPGSIEKNIQITMNRNDEGDDSPFMGIFSEDLTLNQAAQKGYHEFYGIIITGIGPNTPAQKYKLMVDDVLMKIDDNKIADKDQLLKVLQSYTPGDTVQMTVFRNGEVKVIPFVFGSKSKPEVSSGSIIQGEKPKKRHSRGYGGGMWTPVWYMLNTDDVNHILGHTHDHLATGFSNISSKGLFLNGGAGKGTIGKGYFIGGMGAGYLIEKKYSEEDSTHKMAYQVSFGGVTLDKRFHLANHLTGSVGFLLGGGQQDIKIIRQKYVTPSGYDWDDISYVNLDRQEVHMSRSYVVFQPKTEVIYNLLPWLALRGEIGYVLGYSSKDGWDVVNDGHAQVSHSPNSSFDGLTFSVGPWIGF